MNSQSVLQALEQPSRLTEYAMEDLLALVREYPYSTNLRLLVLLKAKQTHDPEFEHYLNRFAAATFDRAHLFNLLEAIEKREEEKGEVLELLELEELELAGFGDPFEELPSRLNELSLPETGPAPLSDPAPVGAPPPTDTPATPLPETEEVTPAPEQHPSGYDWSELADAFYELIPVDEQPVTEPTLPVEVTPPPVAARPLPAAEARPEDPTRFARLVSARRREVPLQVRLRKLRRPRQSPTTTTAGNSTVDHGAVVSETLAALLVRQGQLQHAIKMYRRLILLYPEKKPIFVGLIKDLKEKL